MFIPNQVLFDQAKNVISKSYSPYSKFKVSASLVAENGKIYSGVNIENASYPCGICAEGSAIAAMVTDGAKVIKELLVMVDHNITTKECTPCGLCRQRIREFAAEDLPIHLCNTEKYFKTVTLNDLLYMSFGPDNMEK
ncbi:UNVERIFIED_CONTAM: hypothetical protein PYX00_011171 [Menopon gallinae]|uniref:Cytidine deaminase n=1 Tax=Menopon gallinae TaxID=328185 RepID=A0AAW2H690_9NEOP